MTSSTNPFKFPVMKFLLVSMCILALLAIPAGVAASGGINSRGGGSTTTTALTRHWSASADSFKLSWWNSTLSLTEKDCIYGGGLLMIVRGLELPDHARITRIELSGVDSSADYSRLAVVTKDLDGNDLTGADDFVDSTGATGNGIWGKDVDITIDNFYYTYTLEWISWTSGASEAFCAAIITYELPGTLVSLPFVTK